MPVAGVVRAQGLGSRVLVFCKAQKRVLSLGVERRPQGNNRDPNDGLCLPFCTSMLVLHVRSLT